MVASPEYVLGEWQSVPWEIGERAGSRGPVCHRVIVAGFGTRSWEEQGSGSQLGVV